MKRIDHVSAKGTEPTYNYPTATPGFFDDGDKAEGIDAVVVTDRWLNCVQESLIYLIQQAGLTPAWDKTLTYQSIQAISNSSGAIIGEVREGFFTTAPVGWLLLNGQTIGSAGSSATKHHNNLQSLFTLLWTNLSNTEAPVSGGRGASAAADWGANKSLQLPDARGRTAVGSGQGSGLTNRVLGSTFGTETNVLATGNLPSHNHSISTLTVDIPAHTHSIPVHNHTVPDHSHFVGAHAHIVPSHQHHVQQHVHGMDHTHSGSPHYYNVIGGGGGFSQYSGRDAQTGSASRAYTDNANWDIYTDGQGDIWTGATANNGVQSNGSGVLTASTTGASNTGTAGAVTANASGAATTGNTGSGTAVNNIQPSIAVAKIVFAAPGTAF